MIEISMTVDGVKETIGHIQNIAGIQILRPPMEESVNLLLAYMQDYPGPPQRPYPQMLRTEKQRRYFFWALKNGLIQVPYVRRGKLGQSWTTSVTASGNSLHGIVGTNLKYAVYVMNSQRQAVIHQQNWRTDRMAIEANRAEIVERFRAAIRRHIAAGGSR
jgi:hypothetical protein